MALIRANSSDFQKNISSGLVLVDFYADWCGPCKMIAPVLEQMAKESDEYTIVKLNVDESRDIAEKYQIRSIPTLMIFKDGQHVDTRMGFLPKPQLVQWLDSHK